jgi:two-component system, OmpR family, alkaline phosphatase synthesis response regulator PhoP
LELHILLTEFQTEIFNFGLFNFQLSCVVKTILVVEDERQIAQIAVDYLRRAGFAVLSAADGESAIALTRDRRPDLIVLDLGLPKLDGIQVTRTLRAESTVPIIMLTARVDEDDRLRGLELGADDYITKPFSPRELVARVQAVLRRARAASSGDVVRLGDVTLDVPRLKASRDGHAIDLTATEFQLLATLARQPGRVFSRAQLLDAVRGMQVESFERAIDTHIKNIRRKIEPDPRHPRYIETVYGIGYRSAES